MLKTLKNAWRQPELRNKLLFTAIIIILYRLGASIPVPYLNPAVLSSETNQWVSGGILEYLSMLSGGALAQGTFFALGVSPYITSSIVIQLLTVAIPKLGEKAKDGEEGKKFINMLTRIVTIVLAIITSIGYALLLSRTEFNTAGDKMLLFPTAGKFGAIFPFFVICACYCAGAAIVMWLAEKINESGIGNGISIILFANIIASMSMQVGQLFNGVFPGNTFSLRDMNWSELGHHFDWGGLIIAIVLVAGVVGMLLLIVWMSDAERRIPIQYAKRVVGRKMYGGQNTNLPIKVNMAGVMPIIFASSIVTVPGTIRQMFSSIEPKSWLIWEKIPVLNESKGFWGGFEYWASNILDKWFSQNTLPYVIVFAVLLIAFAFFYIAISFDPVEVANNIKNNGGAILGIRPGKPTVDFIKKVLGRVTLVGALLVGIIAVVPMLAQVALSYIPIVTFYNFGDGYFTGANIDMYGDIISAVGFGGSSMMIVVGVAIETVRELEAQLSLRNYKGFLD